MQNEGIALREHHAAFLFHQLNVFTRKTRVARDLTRSQLQRGAIRDSVSKSLASAKLTLRGRKLVPMDADVERAGRRVAHFVTWLDEQSRVMAT
jgi:hypothetical protein